MNKKSFFSLTLKSKCCHVTSCLWVIYVTIQTPWMDFKFPLSTTKSEKCFSPITVFCSWGEEGVTEPKWTFSLQSLGSCKVNILLMMLPGGRGQKSQRSQPEPDCFAEASREEKKKNHSVLLWCDLAFLLMSLQENCPCQGCNLMQTLYQRWHC